MRRSKSDWVWYLLIFYFVFLTTTAMASVDKNIVVTHVWKNSNKAASALICGGKDNSYSIERFKSYCDKDWNKWITHL